MRKHMVVLGVILAILLVVMLYFAMQDAAQTGEPPNIVGAVAAWVAVAVISVVAMWIRERMVKAGSSLLEHINDRLDE